MKCARCSASLRQIVESGVELDICDVCGGVWLDAGELDRISTIARNSIATLMTVETQVLDCPRCQRNRFIVHQTPFGELTICGNCDGVFIHGETLDAISKCERNELSSKPVTNAMAGSFELLGVLYDLLWLVSHH